MGFTGVSFLALAGLSKPTLRAYLGFALRLAGFLAVKMPNLDAVVSNHIPYMNALLADVTLAAVLRPKAHLATSNTLANHGIFSLVHAA